MISYDILLKNLNEYTNYVISSINTKYGYFLSDKKEKLIHKMMNDKKIVVFDSKIGGNKIHINLKDSQFSGMKIKEMQKYIEEKIIVPEVLKFFITFLLSEKELKNMPQANLHERLCSYLREGFISYISKEFCISNRLSKVEENYNEGLEFILALERKFDGFAGLKSLAFSKEYLHFCQSFYEQTGEDILYFYQNFLVEQRSKKSISEISGIKDEEECVDELVGSERKR